MVERETGLEHVPEFGEEIVVPEIERFYKEEPRLSFLEKLRRSAKNKINAALVVLMVGLGVAKGVIEAKEEAPKEPEKIVAPKERPELALKKTVEEKREFLLKAPEFKWTFVKKGPDGKLHFNWWSLVAPLQVEFPSDVGKTDQAKFDIPYEYSRYFDTGKPLRPADHEKVAEFVDEKLKKNFAEVVFGLDVTGEKPDRALDKVKVVDISFTGTASPEARLYGKESLIPERVEEENLRLAAIRVKEGRKLTDLQMKKLGIDIDSVIKTGKNVETKELQFSENEIKELADLAKNEEGIDSLEKVFNLVNKYNAEKIKDKTVVQKLDRIIGSKRKVEVSITYENKQKKRVKIPVPWLLLLPAAIPFLNRRRETGLPTEIIRKVLPLEKISEPIRKRISQIPPHVKEAHLPPKDSKEYQQMEEATLIDDLYNFFDDEDCIRRGLDYRKIANEVKENYHNFKDNAERENYLTMRILEGWKNHDLEARKEAEVAGDELKLNLDYENQTEQIKWAKMHAAALNKIIQEKIANPEKDYLQLMCPEVKKLMKRRMQRSD